MEYTTQLELYLALLPVFKVKQRLLSIANCKDITNEDIWKYLIINKWKNSHNLTISEIVNDIIMLDTNNIKGAN